MAHRNMRDVRAEDGMCSTSTRKITTEAILASTNKPNGKTDTLEKFLNRITHLHLKGNDKRKILVIENLDLCPNLKVLYLYDNKIEKIENLDANHALTHLYLQNNQLSRIENLSSLRLLTKIYLEGNQVSRLEGFETCFRLEEIHLANQRSAEPFTFDEKSLMALRGSLKVLNLSNCNVHHIKELACLSRLQTLNLAKNNITELQQVFELMAGLYSLCDLNLKNNPVCSLPKYREKSVIFSTQSLQMLDGKVINSRQRAVMQAHAAHKFKKRSTPFSSSDMPRASATPTPSTTKDLITPESRRDLSRTFGTLNPVFQPKRTFRNTAVAALGLRSRTKSAPFSHRAGVSPQTGFGLSVTQLEGNTTRRGNQCE